MNLAQRLLSASDLLELKCSNSFFPPAVKDEQDIAADLSFSTAEINSPSLQTTPALPSNAELKETEHIPDNLSQSLFKAILFYKREQSRVASELDFYVEKFKAVDAELQNQFEKNRELIQENERLTKELIQLSKRRPVEEKLALQLAHLSQSQIEQLASLLEEYKTV